jgi:hypothetical protein
VVDSSDGLLNPKRHRGKSKGKHPSLKLMWEGAQGSRNYIEASNPPCVRTKIAWVAQLHLQQSLPRSLRT